MVSTALQVDEFVLKLNKRQATGSIQRISSFFNCMKIKVYIMTQSSCISLVLVLNIFDLEICTLSVNENMILQLYDHNF